MKTHPFLAGCLAAVLGVLPHAAKAQDPAASQEVSFDFFYNSLADDGAWYNTPEYGYVWQPDIGYKNDTWRPYTDGYWAQTEDGWTWVSYESFGWATYHYGRWTRLKDLGWAWVPGYDWGPGWVSWRTSDERVGWAPLPPKRERVVYEGKIANSEPPAPSLSINYNDVEEDEGAGYTPAVDEQYDIGPQNYCFVESRNFGAPVLSEVILPPQQNFVYVQDTVNVTNITYRRDPGFRDRTIVYNNGPDFAFLSGRSERPIQQLHLQRRDDLAYVRDGIRSGNNPTLVRNGVLQVASPLVSRNAVNFQDVRPARVKETIARPEVVRGWTGVNANPQQVTQLRERIKDNARTAPPAPTANQEVFRRSAAAQAVPLNAAPGQPPVGPGPGRAAREANLPPGAPANAFRAGNGPAGTGPRGDLTDAERAARRDARLQERQQRETTRAAGQPIPQQPAPTNPAAGAPQNPQDRAARQQQHQQAAQQPGATAIPNPVASGQQPSTAGQTKEERRAARQQGRQQPGQGASAQPAQPNAQPQPAAEQKTPKNAQERQERRAQRQQQQQATPQQPNAPAQPAEQTAASPEERQQRRQERQQQHAAEQQPATPQATQGNPAAEQERQQRRQERQQQRAAEQQQPATQPAQQNNAERQQRRAERQQQQATQQQQAAQQPQQERRQERQQQQQAAPQAQQQERQERRQERQQQAAQPQRAAQPQPQPQPQPQQAQGKGKEEEKRKHDQPN